MASGELLILCIIAYKVGCRFRCHIGCHHDLDIFTIAWSVWLWSMIMISFANWIGPRSVHLASSATDLPRRRLAAATGAKSTWSAAAARGPRYPGQQQRRRRGQTNIAAHSSVLGASAAAAYFIANCCTLHGADQLFTGPRANKIVSFVHLRK